MNEAPDFIIEKVVDILEEWIYRMWHGDYKATETCAREIIGVLNE